MDAATTQPTPRLGLLHDLARHGERPALIGPEGPLSYRGLAGRLDEIGPRLGPGRRLVLVAADNSVEAFVHHLAALAAGHVVLLTSGEPAVEERLVAAYDPDVVVRAAGGRAEVVERRRGTAHHLHPDLALLLSTSGSSGSPKLVRLSYANLQSNAEAIATYLGLGADDRAMTSLPLHYCYGLSVLHSHLAAGASVVVTDLSVVDRCFWDLARRWSATSFAGVPHTFELLDRCGVDRIDLPSLRYVTQAGGKMAPDTVVRYARMAARDGWQLFVMYGQTEATARMAYLPPHLAATSPGAIGVAIPGGAFSLRPCDEAAGPAEGELVYRGPNVMLGYATTPSDLARGGDLDCLPTGDLARRTGDGLFEIVGRRSRFLKLYGLRVDLDHMERTLSSRGVAGTCAGDDARLVVAVRHAADEALAQEVATAGFGLPRSCVAVTVVDELPRLASGKVDHQAIVRAAAVGAPARAAADRRATAGPCPGTGTTAAIRALYAETLGLDHVDAGATFVGLGGDSLSYIETSMGLEEILGRLPPQWHTTPLAHLAHEVERDEPAPAPSRLETGIVLRAVAIVLVVGTHAGLVDLMGGAHVLLAVAGFTFARFQLAAVQQLAGVRSLARSIGRIAVPTLAVTSFLAVASGGYGLANLALLNSHLGPSTWDRRWRFWYVEALLQILAAAAVALSSRRLRALEHRHPFGVAAGIAAAALTLRFGLDLGDGILATHRPQAVLWVFALGWVAERATTWRRRLLVTSAVLAGVPGFFGAPPRELLVAGGLLLLLWVRSVPVPNALRRPVSAVAAASLSIYLVHWLLYRAVADRSPLLAVLASIGAGLAARHLAARAGGPARRAVARVVAAASAGRSRWRSLGGWAGGRVPLEEV